MRRRVQLNCEPHTRAARVARAFVITTLESWSLQELGDLAALCTSELVTNAIVHAGTPFELAVELDRPRLVIAVRDHEAIAPVLGHPSTRSEHGRGLMLVQALATEWGYQEDEDGGKRVWCSLDTAAR